MNKIPYSFNDKYVLRTPALSILEIEKITSSQNIKDLLSNPFISESIYLTSPELYDEVQRKIKEGQSFDSKIESTFVKFILRICFRCNPFGLFARFSLGFFKVEETNIELNPMGFKSYTN